MQLEMEKEGMTKKEVESLSSEKKKPEEVDMFLERPDLTEKQKQDRLYTEVRYARDTTLSLPKKSDLFRLKEKYKTFSVERFAANLKVYLGKISSSIKVLPTG